MSHQNPLFVFFGNNSFGNRGCEAIVRSTLSILQEHFGLCQFINALMFPTKPSTMASLGNNVKHVFPSIIEKKHIGQKGWIAYRIKKMKSRSFKELFELYLPKATAAIALGGDNYSLDYGDPCRYFQANEIVLAKNKPLILWGASIGPFSSKPDIERYAAQSLKKASLICARESETVGYLNSIGISHNVRQVTDPAFVLEPSPIELFSADMRVIEHPCIGMNFSPLMSIYWRQGQPWEQCVAGCIKKCLDKFNLPVFLIPHVIWPANDDHAFMKKIVDDYDLPKDKVILVSRDYNAQQLKWIIAQMELFVGCRTHATIASLSSAVPTLSIGYSLKAKGINKDIFGNTDWLISLEGFNPEHLIEKMSFMIKTHPNVKQHLVDVMTDYKKQAYAAGGYLKETLNSV